MERSDKQRKPVAIKNLAELKRFIQPGVEFKTLSQKNHPDLVGLTRIVTTVQTVCFYSKIKDQPNSRFSTDNGGKGFRTDFAKADAYIFDGTTVKVKDTRNKDRGVIYEFEFYDREQTMQEDTNMDRKMVNFIKEQYPPGTRIRLNSMEDPYAPIVPGTEGKVFPAASKNNGTRRLFDTFSQMRNTQAIHCGRKHIPAIHFPQPGIKIPGSMNSFMRWGLILQLSQKKPLSRHSNWRRNGNPLTGRSSGVNHIHYPRKYHAVTAAARIAEKNKYPRRIGAVENMIHP